MPCFRYMRRNIFDNKKKAIDENDRKGILPVRIDVRNCVRRRKHRCIERSASTVV